MTLTETKTMLVIAHTAVYVQRLLDIFPLLGADFRIQVVFTAPPHAFQDGVEAILRRLGSTVLPWEEAVRLRFDLAIAAGPQGVEQIQAPVIMVPHGANFLKRMVGPGDSSAAGLRPADLTPTGGEPPSAMVLAHHADRGELARTYPEALPRTTVAGDPTRDRIVASLPERERYRTALGLRSGQRLLAVATTWGPRSFFTRFETLLPWLAAEVDEDCRIAVLIHTNVWAGHGPWQVRSWLSRCQQRGIHLVPPEEDWRSVLICADWIIGDHGSATLYGTLTQAPILLASSPEREINPSSPAAALAQLAPTLTPICPLREQLAYAAEEYRPEEYRPIASRISSEPGRFSRNIRTLMYRMLGLGQPAYSAATEPLPLPSALADWQDRPVENRWTPQDPGSEVSE